MCPESEGILYTFADSQAWVKTWGMGRKRPGQNVGFKFEKSNFNEI